MLGDFNNEASVKGEGYDFLIENGFYDTYLLAKAKDDGVTVKGEIGGWEGNKTEKRIDLILANCQIPVNYSKVIFNGVNKSIVSDHFGGEVEISLD